MTILLRIAERALNRPLLIHPDKVPLILAVLQGRIPLGDVSGWKADAEARIAEMPEDARAVMFGPAPNASRFVGSPVEEDSGGRRQLPYKRTPEGVAVIPVIGTLVNRGAWLGSNSGETSYEGLKYQVAAAVADPKATSILLDIESPGGEAVGAFEMAAAIRDASTKKPVVAVVNGMAASAAYAIASGASKIITTDTGVAGSIGVVMLHADFSRQLDKQGITPTLLFAGAHKVDGNPFEPLPDGVRADLQREINQFYDMFVQTVADGRQNMSAAAIRGTEARVYIGAEAVNIGLADQVGTFESALADLSRGASRSPSIQPKGKAMDKPTGAPAADTAGITKAELDTAVAAARAEGKTEGLTEGNAVGAAAERERIKAIQSAAFAGQEALAASLIDKGTSVGEAALALNADHKAKGAHLEEIASMDKQLSGVKGAPAAGGDGGRTTFEQNEAGWKAEFAAGKTGFVDEASYVAFKKAETGGRVKILSSKAA